jgi:hypothetical protein
MPESGGRRPSGKSWRGVLKKPLSHQLICVLAANEREKDKKARSFSPSSGVLRRIGY